MSYFLCFFSFVLCLLFNPVYDNYTSLLNSQYRLLFLVWILILDFFLVKNILKHTLSKNEKIFIAVLSLLFIIGSYLPYYTSIYLFSFLHVFLPMISIIFYLLYIFYIILRFYKKEPLQAQSLYQWYFWGLSIISLLIIFFGHINGIIEITTFIFTTFILEKLKIINYS